ncbi:MAG: HlyD family efflux transporter periplasmic adaptor subunit [Pirellulaceae bacterium]
MFCLILIAGLPTPMTVSVRGLLEPIDHQIVYAPQDAFVSTLHVDHGDIVQAGDLLATLIDPQLDQQIDECLGEQSVLQEQMRELQTAMISMVNKSAEERGRIEGDFKVVRQKLDGNGRQLQLLQQQRDQLTVRAQQSGRVVGWRMRQQLADRPVHRSQQLMEVVADDGGWIVRAEVPQDRIDHVLRRLGDGSKRTILEADVVFQSFPNQAVRGELRQVGLAAFADSTNPPTGIAEVAVPTTELPIRQSGAAATVAIPCGTKPLFYVAFQDLIRTISQTIRIYL